MRVLIAEDDPVSRRLLSHLLREMGFEPVVVDCGHSALQTIKDDGIQLAVLDWDMPGLSGPEVCRRLRDSGRMVYTIILTGRETDEDMLEALESGASDFLTKPTRRIDLFSRLRVGRRVTELHARFAESSRSEAVAHLAAGMAHEINTPVQFLGDNLRFLAEGTEGLVAMTRTLREIIVASDHPGEEPGCALKESLARLPDLDIDYLAEEMPRALRESLEGVERIAGIIGSLYEFARPDSDPGGEGGGTEEVRLSAALEPVITLLRTRIPADMGFVVEIPETLPPLRIDRRRFCEVVMNIVTNAIEVLVAQPRPWAAQPSVHLVAAERDGAVELAIEDNGPGIPAQDLDRVFDPFFTTKALGGGPGLGLHTARRVIEEIHGGRILVDSDHHPGARLLIRIPLGTTDAGEADHAA